MHLTVHHAPHAPRPAATPFVPRLRKPPPGNAVMARPPPPRPRPPWYTPTLIHMAHTHTGFFWPQVRAHVEQQLDLIAKGRANKEAVVAHTVEQVRGAQHPPRRQFRYMVPKLIGKSDRCFYYLGHTFASACECNTIAVLL